MPMTIVKCSVPGCSHEAVSKIAATWQGGGHTELKTYGYTCPEHSKAMTEYALKRPKSAHLAEAESVGPVATFPLAHA